MTRRLPITATAALAIAIIVATEFVFVAKAEPLTGLPVFQPTVDDATLVVKRKLLQKSAGQIVFVGDSSCMMGLDSQVFERAGLGRPVNLGTLLSLTLPGFADLAQEALAAAPPPRAVVLSVLPRSFEVTEAQARDFGLLGRYLVAYGRWSSAYKRDLEDTASWFFRKHRFNIFSPEYGRSFADYGGRLEAANGHYSEPTTYLGVKPQDVRQTFKPTDYSRAGVILLARAAQARGVPVIFWWSPTPSDAVSSEYLADASDYVQAISAEVQALQVARPAPAWNPGLFSSVTHLKPAGATSNSDELAQYLARVLK